jgi:hypothetical protein
MDKKELERIQELSNSVDEKYQLVTFETLLKTSLVNQDIPSKEKGLKKEIVNEKVKPIQKKEIGQMSLKNITIKGLPDSEKEWVLIYGYFASKNGESFFKRDDLVILYEESSRKTQSRLNNLSNNIKRLVTLEFFRFINDEDIALTEEGQSQVSDILNR